MVAAAALSERDVPRSKGARAGVCGDENFLYVQMFAVVVVGQARFVRRREAGGGGWAAAAAERGVLPMKAELDGGWRRTRCGPRFPTVCIRSIAHAGVQSAGVVML